MKQPFAIAACVALLAFFAPDLRAQQAAATLRGVASDPNGAVVSGALVTLTQQSTGVRRETTTNGEGIYTLTNLAAGDYRLDVTATGFKAPPLVVTLQVGQSTTLNVPLEVASVVADSVTVADSGSPVDQTSSKVDGVVGAREIANLPLNGRNFLELALLIPGNAPAPNFDPTKSNTVVISSAGQLGRGGNMTVDGADSNDDVVGGQVQNVSQDAVQEFQIGANTASSRRPSLSPLAAPSLIFIT